LKNTPEKGGNKASRNRREGECMTTPFEALEKLAAREAALAKQKKADLEELKKQWAIKAEELFASAMVAVVDAAQKGHHGVAVPNVSLNHVSGEDLRTCIAGIFQNEFMTLGMPSQVRVSAKSGGGGAYCEVWHYLYMEW